MIPPGRWYRSGRCLPPPGRADTKHILVVSDPHCGHWAGLSDDDHLLPEQTATGRMQRELRSIVDAGLEDLTPPGGFDWAVNLGDCIDGKGERSEGVEQVEPDRMKQAEMCIRLLETIPTPGWSLVYGTPYHTGVGEDFERVVADGLPNATIHGISFLPVEGIIINLRHHIASSSVPYGGMTPLAKERFALAQWSHEQGWPNPDIILRGHVHEMQTAGEACGQDTASGRWEARTLPALQAASTKYGRRLSKVVHFGLGRLDVDGTDWSWHWYVRTIEAARPHVLEALR